MKKYFCWPPSVNNLFFSERLTVAVRDEPGKPSKRVAATKSEGRLEYGEGGCGHNMGEVYKVPKYIDYFVRRPGLELVGCPRGVGKQRVKLVRRS